MTLIFDLWRLCREANRYRWRAIGAFVVCVVASPVLLWQGAPPYPAGHEEPTPHPGR